MPSKQEIIKMKIKIISPETISLTGSPGNLVEKEFQNNDDKKLEFIPGSDVKYEDLVFTLKHNPGSYICPYLRFERNRLVVAAHNIFFNAGKEASLDKMNFNLVKAPNLPLEKIMEEYGLEFTPPAVQKEYMEEFLFYMNSVGEVESNSPIVFMNPLNNTEEFRKRHCIAYKIFTGDINELRSCESQLMEELYQRGNKIRSINGLKEPTTRTRKYF